MPKSSDRLAGLAKAIKAADRAILREWKRADSIIRKCARRGDYEGAAMVRRQAAETVDRLRDERVYLRKQMPPFLTEENGFLRMHPVTPENAHLLES